MEENIDPETLEAIANNYGEDTITMDQVSETSKKLAGHTKTILLAKKHIDVEINYLVTLKNNLGYTTLLLLFIVIPAKMYFDLDIKNAVNITIVTGINWLVFESATRRLKSLHDDAFEKIVNEYKKVTYYSVSLWKPIKQEDE